MISNPKRAGQQWRVAPPEPLLLATKFFPPPVRPDAVPRPQLTARLEAALAAPLTVIAAPAGSGKTSLLAEWVAAQRRAAWLSLDSGDNDPATFARYLVAALRRVAPGVGSATLELIGAPRPMPLTAALAPLVNELAEAGGDLILVLDDFHELADADLLAGVAFLCERCPPGLHLVLAGRDEPPLPLARMRARRQLVELGAADLRFSPGEAEALLNGSFGLALSPAQLDTLETRTEGWAAGLQLAGLALRGRPDVAGLVAGFGGSSRYIFDYLAAEVLDGLPAHLRDFLLRTAVLPRLCGELCDAALGLDAGQGYSSLILAELERRNLFLVPLDDKREWYRYHHLFAELLRAQLRRGAAPDELATIHQRAGAWFAAHEQVAEAVEQLLAGGDQAAAGALIAAHSRDLLFAGHLSTVRAWFAALAPAQVSANPDLAIAAAWSALFDSDTARADELVAAAEAGNSSGAPLVDGLALRSILLSVSERHTEAAALGDAALRALPPASPVRSIVAAGQSFSCLIAGNISGGEEVVHTILATVPQLPATLLLRTHFNTMLGMAARMRGRLREADRIFDEAIALLDSSPVLVPIPTALPTLNEAAVVRYMRDNLPGAAALVARANAYADKSADASLQLPVRWLEARMLAARGEIAGAIAHLEANARAIGAAPPLRRGIIQAEQVRLYLLAGDLAAAEAVATDLRANGALLARLGPYPEIGLAESRLLLGQGRPREAVAALDEMMRAAEIAGHGQLIIQILALRAVAHAAAGTGMAANSDIGRALELAVAAEAPRLLLDEAPALTALLRDGGWRRRTQASSVAALADRILGEAGPAPGASPTGDKQYEPLTARERDVLRLLDAGRSNRAIAAELVVAEGTVKRHVANLCAKLGVESRLEAVARARLLGLL